MKTIIKALFIALALSACADEKGADSNKKNANESSISNKKANRNASKTSDKNAQSVGESGVSQKNENSQNASQNADKVLLDSELSAFYEQIIRSGLPDAKVSVKSREKIGAYEQITLEISSGGQRETQTIFARGGFLFPDIIDVRAKKSFLEEVEVREYQRKKREFKARAQVALRSERAVIELGDARKPLMYVFSDPECPYCRMHLAKIEDELKLYRLKLVLTTIHGERAFAKVAAIYARIKNDMSDTEKIAILREFYAPNAPTPKVSAGELKKARDLLEKYQDLGLRGVPTMVEGE